MKNAMQLKAIMKKLAKENQISAQLVLQNYMLERFLERVSLSPYRDNYIIKGGFLISSMVGLNSRATMDMDATIKGYPVTQDAVQKMIEQMQRIQDTFWAMHEITYEVEEVDTTPEPTEDDPDPEQQTDYILHITVSSKTVDELAELYNFTQDQKDILHQLLSEEMRPSLLALCGGIAVADGELCWPLPGHTYISCHFGEVDAFGNAGHRGTDIPAPEGTPILAAHSGTVLVSGWNDSYGNQVLLDNGAGLSTRYAHMTQTAVTAGEAVTAGQIIGYVGSTGDSTGNHLHFEVMQNGVRMNPLELVFAQ